MGPGNSQAFNFSVLEPRKKPGITGQICGKIPAKSPGSPETDNTVEQQLRIVLMKNMRVSLHFLNFYMSMYRYVYKLNKDHRFYSN